MNSGKATFVVLIVVLLNFLDSRLGYSLSPPAPPPLGIEQLLEKSEFVFSGRISKVSWQLQSETVTPTFSGIGVLSVEVEIRQVLFGGGKGLSRRINYLIGQTGLSEEVAQKTYLGREFIFFGKLETSRGSNGVESRFVYFPPSGLPPMELKRKAEVEKEIAGRHRTSHIPPNHTTPTKN